MKFTILFLWLAILSGGEAYKILVIAPTPATSHYNLCKAIADILHERGHEITFISSFEPKKPLYREISLPEMMAFKSVDFNMNKVSKLQTIKILNTWIPNMTEALFKNPKVVALLSNPAEKFDLVIMEFFMNEAVLGLGEKYDCPIIPVSSVSLTSWLAMMTGNPLSISTVPNVFTPFTSNMNLWQRTANTLAHAFQQFMGWYMMHPRQVELYEKIFPEEAKRTPLHKLKDRIALVLINSHPSIAPVRALLPNAVEIGGYHIQEVSPLPQDLQTLMDNAKDGVILFSMGGNLKSADMDESKKRDILAALGTVNQLVLWKFEEDLPNKPKNVIIRPWLPQVSILAHPNTRLFISHGGFVSCTESGYFGIPLLAVPIYGDQHHNTANAIERGYALKVDYDTLTKQSLLEPLQEMLRNPRYNQSAKKIKNIFHDRPVPPRDLVVFYTEHAIRTQGAKHLTPPQLNIFQSMLLDVMIVILTPLVVLIFLALFVLKKCLGIFRKKEVKQQRKQKRN